MSEETKFTRNCPECDKEIHYKYKSDYTKACKRDSKCKSCAVKKSSIFQTGHTLNDKVVRKNSLNRLIEDESLQTFYWVGFLIADGSFYNKGKFELGLAEKDVEVLEEFSKYIDYQNKLMYREGTKSYRISFSNSKDVPKFMEKYGFKLRKTYNPIDFSIYNKYTKGQLMALLIGIIDGDGHIANNGSSGAFAITITAHTSWEQFYIDLLTYLDLSHSIVHRKEGNCLTIRMYRKEIIQDLVNLINTNNLFHLKRKWEIIKIKKDALIAEE